MSHDKRVYVHAALLLYVQNLSSSTFKMEKRLAIQIVGGAAGNHRGLPPVLISAGGMKFDIVVVSPRHRSAKNMGPSKLDITACRRRRRVGMYDAPARSCSLQMPASPDVLSRGAL